MKNISNEYINSLKERFLKLGNDSLLEVELLELLLSYSVDKKEILNLSKKFIELGGIKKIFDQPVESLKRKGIDSEAIILFKLFHGLMTNYLEPNIYETFDLSSPYSVADYLSLYLRVEIGKSEQENFMVFFLNSQNKLIHKEIMFRGTVNQCQVYPREIIKLALLKNANALILAHNHPSGLCRPSKEDIILTQNIEKISSYFELRVHDHIITTENGIYSIKLDTLIN